MTTIGNHCPCCGADEPAWNGQFADMGYWDRDTELAKSTDEIERLRAVLRALVDNVLDYERVNNLSPNPGRKYCWDTVANAVEALNQQLAEKA